MTTTEEPPRPLQEEFLKDVLHGLSQPQKRISSKWAYDQKGSELYKKVTESTLYTLTRDDCEILNTRGLEIAGLVGPGRVLIEYGAGDPDKALLLLKNYQASCYIPVDISGDFLKHACKDMQKTTPGLRVVPLEADFTKPIQLPPDYEDSPKLGFFPGSTLSQMDPFAAASLLRVFRESLGDDGMLLIGLDKIKIPEDKMIGMYAQKCLCDVVCNIIHRINRELNGTVPLDALEYKVVWDEDHERIEMFFESKSDVEFSVKGHSFSLEAGERIDMAVSYKFDERSARLILRAGGWEPVEIYQSESRAFLNILAKARRDPSEK